MSPSSTAVPVDVPGCRGEHIVGAIAAVAATMAIAGSGRTSPQIAVSVLLVASGTRWARGATGGRRVSRVLVVWAAVLIGCGAGLAVTLRAGQAGQLRTVTRDALASLAGLANVRFGTPDLSSSAPLPMGSVYFPFVVFALWLQSVVVLELVARGRRIGRRPDGSVAGLRVGAIIAGFWVAVVAGAVLAVVSEDPVAWWRSPWRLAEFFLGALIAVPSSRRDGRPVLSVRGRLAGSRVIIPSVIGFCLLWMIAITGWDGTRGHVGTIADADSPLVVAGVAAGSLLCIGLLDGWLRSHEGTWRWEWPVAEIGRLGVVPLVFGGSAALLIRHGDLTHSHGATAVWATVGCLVIAGVIVAAIWRGPGVFIAGLSIIQVIVLMVGTATVTIPETGARSADPEATVGRRPESPVTVGHRTVIVGDDSLLSLMRTTGLAFDGAVDPSRCGMLRRGSRRTAVAENLDRMCPPWAADLERLDVDESVTVIVGVGVWDLFDWLPDGAEGAARSVADPELADAVADELDHVVDEVTQRGANAVVVGALPSPYPMEQVGPQALEPVWSPARRRAWNTQLSALAERWPHHVRIVIAPSGAVEAGTLIRPDGIHVAGSPAEAFVSDLQGAIGRW